MIMREESIIEITRNRNLKKTIDNSKVKNLSEIFGENCFNDKAMKKFLDTKTYKALKKIIKEGGGKIDAKLAEKVAQGMKEWAISKGATHFTHWFQPMTGLTAEKHDSFLNFDAKGKPLVKFSGKNLIQGEPDASSFPSGGLRTTFEARGYTAWDPTSPAFVVKGINGSTLCIPTVFLSYTGEALDKKTPLLRSMEKLSEVAVKILNLFGNNHVKRVYPTVGPEQEYFLIDKAYYNQRPDLILTGRTLFGAKSPKGQEMEDHYFGSIRERVLAFMHDSENELFQLGVPVKTRHNEVAPSQFEIAPIFEDSNIATDHNQITMETLKKIADKHNFALLLHEKPFAGINGSGKHNNWSLSDSDGNNLLEPGKTPHDNLQFLTFFVATITAVYRYSDVLRASIATPGNDHRLGANEAPPAIISVFIGKQLTGILENLKNYTKTEYSDEKIIDLGISKLPTISKDNTDRNRTSPFAFTGNKFEFRAVGSSQSIAPANYTINTIVTEVLDEFAKKIEDNLKQGMDLNKAVLDVLIPAIKESDPVRFDGNNYDKNWEIEAEKRGLPNKKTTPESLKDLISEKNMSLFIKYGVLSETELKSRYNVFVENYSKTINIEAETALSMAKTIILPAALKYQKEIAETIKSTSKIEGIEKSVIEKEIQLLKEYSESVSKLIDMIKKMESNLINVQSINDKVKQADSYCNIILPIMDEMREIADKIEEKTDDKIWPLPKYREMLFVY